MEYLSDFQTALKWNVTVEQVRKGCVYGLVSGAVYKNGVWMIPEGKKRPSDFLAFIGAEKLEKKKNKETEQTNRRKKAETITIIYDNTDSHQKETAYERIIWKKFPNLESVLFVALSPSDKRIICSRDRKELVRLDKVVVLNDKKKHQHVYAYYQCPYCNRKFVSFTDARDIVSLIQSKDSMKRLRTTNARSNSVSRRPVMTDRQKSPVQQGKPSVSTKQTSHNNGQEANSVSPIAIKNGQILKEPKGWTYYVVMHSFDIYIAIDLNNREYQFKLSAILDKHMEIVRGGENERLQKQFAQKCDRKIRLLLNRYKVADNPQKPFELTRSLDSSIEKYPVGTVLNRKREYAVCIVKSNPGHVEVLDMRNNLEVVEGNALYDGTFELFSDIHLSRILQETFFQEFSAYFDSTKGELAASLSKKNPDLDISAKDFVVRSNTFRCLHKQHSIENINAVVTIIDAKTGIHLEYRASAGYCRQCHTYFISDKTFEKIKAKGVALCRICDEKTYRKNECTITANGMHLASESILMQYGYNVNQQRNLSERTRRSILESLVDYHILSKSDIESYLNFFIRGRQQDPKFHTAVSKWKADRDYIMQYKRNSSREVSVRSIHRK